MKHKRKMISEKHRAKEMYVYKLYRNLFVLATLFIGISEIVQYKSLGEAPGFILRLDRIDLSFLLFLHTLSIFLMIPAFNTTKRCQIRIKKSIYHLCFDEKKIDIFILLLLIANIAFTIKTGNGVVGGKVSSGYSFLFNIIKVRPLLAIYYVCRREHANKFFWINCVLYASFELICGWTGFFLAYFFYEFFMYVRRVGTAKSIQIIYKLSLPTVAMMFIVGGGLYRYLVYLKYQIRLGINVGIPTFQEGIEALVSRLTNFPITVVAVQEHDKVAYLYNVQDIPYAEVLNIFRPLLPGFIMRNKDFRILGNIVKQAIYPDIGKDTSTGYCPFVYWYNLFESDYGCFLLGAFIFILLICITHRIIYLFNDGTGNVDILWFLFIASIFGDGANLGNLFGYGYTSLVYTLPILYLLGILRVKTDSNNSDNGKGNMLKQSSFAT